MIKNRVNRKALVNLLQTDNPLTKGEITNIAQRVGVTNKVVMPKDLDGILGAMKDRGYGKIRRFFAKPMMKRTLQKGDNAFFIPPGNKKYQDMPHLIVAGNKASPSLIAHEHGHAKDFEQLGRRFRGRGKNILLSEERAWANTPLDLRKGKEEALKTYRQGGAINSFIGKDVPLLQGLLQARASLHKPYFKITPKG